MKKLKVAWLSPLSLYRFRQQLNIDEKKFFNLHPATWVTVMLEEMEKREDIELHIITTASNKVIDKNQTFTVNGITYHIIKRGLPFIKKGWPYYFRFDTMTNYWWRTRKMSSILKRIKPDVVTAFGTENEFSLPLFKLKVPSIILIQGLIGSHQLKTRFLQKQALLEALALNKVKHFMNGKSIFIENFVKRYNPEAEFCNLDFPISNYAFSFESARQRTTDIVFASGISRAKGIFDLIEALVIIKKQLPGIKLRILGKNAEPDYSELLVKISSMELTDNVEMAGFLPDHADFINAMSTSRVFVLPSYFDTGSRTLAEAMALGLPSVIYNIDGASEMIKDGVTGLLVEPGDIDSLATSIIALLSDEEKMSQVGSHAKKFAFDNYYAPEMVNELIKYYNYMLKTSK